MTERVWQCHWDGMGFIPCDAANPIHDRAICGWRGFSLVDIAAIAERLGVPKDTVNKWRYRGVLPEPDYQLAVGPVWDWETIEAWAKTTNRLTR